jgi:hypothetical protein
MMIGKVTQLDSVTKTVTAKGKPVNFHGEKLKSLPRPGDVVDTTYTENPGGPLESVHLNSPRAT